VVAAEARGVDPSSEAGSTSAGADTRGARTRTRGASARACSDTCVTGPGPGARAEAGNTPG
jgi:hypothetical protein